MAAQVFDSRACFLGEGPLWHPEREQLFWFDIINRQLLTQAGESKKAWTFDEMVSAAGWIDREHLLVAGETSLKKFNIETGAHDVVAPLDLGPGRRSNDGRADPWGGFWISSMDKTAKADAGAIYRYFGGKVEKLFSGITIPNAICFSPDRGFAHFADTDRSIVKRVRLDTANGRPVGEPEIYLDLADEGLNPDGAVIDAQGNMWVAQWGAGRVACYDPAGNFAGAAEVGAPHSSCPAFGGPDLATLFCTTAREGMDAQALAAHPQAGMVFSLGGVATGQPEPRVTL